MIPEDLSELVSNPRLIPGIHNYCDRWCERCPRTLRCSVFEIEQRNAAQQPSSDQENQSFWKAIEDSLALALQMLEQRLQAEGIELTDELLRQSDRDLEQSANRAANARCVQLARQYARLASQALEQFDRQRSQCKPLGIDFPKPHAEALEIVSWYQSFLYTKLRRATESAQDEIGLDDANGSAKVALVAADRSLSAWGQLLNAYPEHQDAIFPLLTLLQKITSEAEASFPQARDFKRPGLD
ncbi:hypothetical protein [Pelagicoccus sp. SDUM812005]|uniref:hypothetical protein n=1 Tax=Pelagicoccus sp. SDUM812005 TaxID=3041257 RepID=UPI00280DC257|nr:hypothetical protein [Pelagicoccus sp. SDUM812005]MDQ8182553.1 hypothetical protein [Pelagicoccus sp. SDUM812005]